MDVPDGVKCVIFDLDGTLADFPIDYVAMRAALQALATTHRQHSNFRPLIPEARRLAGADHNLRSEFFAIIDKYETASLAAAVPHDNVLALYASCADRGLKTAILTRNGKKLVEGFLKRFHLATPDIICSRDDAEQLKPHPEQMEFVLKRLKLSPTNAMLIGDDEHDEALARVTHVLFHDCTKVKT